MSQQNLRAEFLRMKPCEKVFGQQDNSLIPLLKHKYRQRCFEFHEQGKI